MGAKAVSTLFFIGCVLVIVAGVVYALADLFAEYYND
jgi:hypothetical protein